MNLYRPYVLAWAAVAIALAAVDVASALSFTVGGIVAAIAIGIAIVATVASFVAVIVALEIFDRGSLDALARLGYRWLALLKGYHEWPPLLGRDRGWLRNPFVRGRLSDDGSLVYLSATATTAERLVSILLQSALAQLPPQVRERWAEEWAEHGAQRNGWRLVWWALCVRATATRTGREYRCARLPQGD